jgi:hypothetical protein
MKKVTKDSDYRTHHCDWVSACQIAKDNANNDADRSYWEHQLITLKKLDEEFKLAETSQV